MSTTTPEVQQQGRVQGGTLAPPPQTPVSGSVPGPILSHEASEVPGRVKERAFTWHVLEVAHEQTRGAYDRYSRAIGLIVVMLTTIIGTSVYASLTEHSTSSTAKIIVGSIGLLAAAAAAWKENAQYGKLSSDHGTASCQFQKLYHEAEQLLDEFNWGTIEIADLDAGLCDREREAENLRPPVVSQRRYDHAEEWVSKHPPGSPQLKRHWWERRKQA